MCRKDNKKIPNDKDSKVWTGRGGQCSPMPPSCFVVDGIEKHSKNSTRPKDFEGGTEEKSSKTVF